MDFVSWTIDYFPALMLAMAQRAEQRFAECLMSCPKTDDNVIRIDDPEIFTRLLEARIDSLLLSLSALESFLAFYAARTAARIEAEDPGISLLEYMDKNKITDVIKHQASRVKRRHELIVEENGDKPASRFLNKVKLTLEEKLFYWPLMRTYTMVSYKDGYMKKLSRLMQLRDELMHPDLGIAYELKKASSVAELKKAFLHIELPEGLTPGVSCSDEYVIEPYNEEHFLWELLHVYPARTVQEVIQYIYRMDNTGNHFIVAQKIAELVDASGAPVTETVKRHVIEVDLED